jgi:hypothetical protein
MRYPAADVLQDPDEIATSILEAVRGGWEPDTA